MKRKILSKFLGAVFCCGMMVLKSGILCQAADIGENHLTSKSYVFDLNDLDSEEMKEIYDLSDDAIPEKYNLKDRMDIVVEDQGTWDLCDFFASVKCIETNYALKTGSFVDLSERYLDYLSSRYLYGDREPGSLNDGSTMLLASIYGVASEAEIPKEEYEDLSAILNAAPVCRVVRTVDFRELNQTDETNLKLLNIIKQHIMKYGSLAVGISSPDQVSGAYHNGNIAYYYKKGILKEELRPGHQVSIVGWDDTYPKENFNETPDLDGAFICLNSWGESWGQNGYFYVSYDTLSEFECLNGVLETRTCPAQETEYTYAEGLYTLGEVKAANRIDKYYGVIFDTQKPGEYLTHIALGMTSNPGKIKLYCNPVDGEFDRNKYVYLGETAIGFWGQTLMDWEDPIEITGDQFALVFEINYDEEMNDDFISNDPSLTHETHEIISGHFYNSSQPDTGFEQMDYDLRLYVYTGQKTPDEEEITSTTDDTDQKDTDQKDTDQKDTDLESTDQKDTDQKDTDLESTDQEEKEREESGRQSFHALTAAGIMGGILVLAVCVWIICRKILKK